jgi:hypothetical protein
MNRLCYFVLITEKTDKGFVPLIAKEDESGYYRTDWIWDCSFEEAQQLCNEKNKRLGLTEIEAMKIQLSSMRSK